MSPPFRVGRHKKTFKLYSRNCIQISINMSWRAECKNGYSAIDSFLVISLGTLSITKLCHNQPLFITDVLRELIQTQWIHSRHCIQISINISRRAECKNGNSTIDSFLVISLGTLSHHKNLSQSTFIHHICLTWDDTKTV